MYTGQLDIIVAIPLTEAFLMTVPWKGLAEYKKADRLVWKINPNDKEVAGYVRQVGSFYQVSMQEILTRQYKAHVEQSGWCKGTIPLVKKWPDKFDKTVHTI